MSFIDKIIKEWQEHFKKPGNKTLGTLPNDWKLELEELITNESIKFAEWIAHYEYEQNFDTKLWCYWDNGLLPKNEYTTEELFELFKKETINE